MRLAFFGQVDVTAKANAVVSEIERQYRAGAVKVRLSPDAITRFLVLGAAFPFVSASSQEQAIQKNLQVLGERIKKWKTIYRRWAEQGKRDDGSAYTWERWISFGTEDIASEIKYQTGEGWNSSVVIALAKATAASAKEVAELVEKIGEQAKKIAPELPSILKWVAGAVIVGGAAYVLSPLIRLGRR